MCFWFLGLVLDSRKCWIRGSVFEFWDVFWILGSVLSPRATVHYICDYMTHISREFDR